MKFRIILCFLFFGAGVCKASPVPLNSDEQEARAFAQNASLKLYNYHNELSYAIFEGFHTGAGKVLETGIRISKQIHEIFNASKQFHDDKLTDPELKYAFKKLRESTREEVLGDDKLASIILSMVELRKLRTDNDIPAYHNESFELAFYPDIQEILTKSKDPEELKYYWIKWRDHNGAYAAQHIENMIEKRKEAAKINEITPLKFFLKQYNITEIENIMMQMEPLYLQLHGFIRKQLLKKYGYVVIKENEPIPHHLFEQVLAQAWTSESIIDEMYPSHKDLPPYDEILKQNNFDTLKMFKTADQFFKSLGLDSVPDEYWGNNFEMNSIEDKGDDCKSLVLDNSPNVHLRYCQKMDFKKFLQAHGYMSVIYFAREKIDLPAYYFDSYGLQYPVGEAVILSASTRKHLDNIGLDIDSRYTTELEMNRLLRMGIHTLLNVPVYFVHTKVMADLFSGSVRMTNINKHYWKLMGKYVGVAPPVDRDCNAIDFSSQFYTELSQSSQPNKFMTEVLGYQFYENFCEISGQFSRSNKSEPIYNCDFYGSKIVGDALKKMMRLGSSKPMREVLATIFPENPTVNAESLIEYYGPMKSWLVEMNLKSNAIIGWSHSDEEGSLKCEDNTQEKKE